MLGRGWINQRLPFISFYFILGLSDVTCIEKRKDPHLFWFLLKCLPMFSSFSYIYIYICVCVCVCVCVCERESFFEGYDH